MYNNQDIMNDNYTDKDKIVNPNLNLVQFIKFYIF